MVATSRWVPSIVKGARARLTGTAKVLGPEMATSLSQASKEVLHGAANMTEKVLMWGIAPHGIEKPTLEPAGPAKQQENPHEGDDYKLFREEDVDAWIVFTVVFMCLIMFDNCVLHRSQARISFRTAVFYTFFWLLCAACFCGYVYYERGPQDAIEWGTGYVLEWMLSVDNLFVFHRIFSVFKTPDDQKHKPLFWGIAGAIVFRMAFFCIEEALMHNVTWMHVVFGLFLIYTGIKAAMADEEEDSPENSAVFNYIANRINYIDMYDANGGFFVMAPVDAKTGEVLLFEGVGADPPNPEEAMAHMGTPYIRFETPPYPTDNEVVYRWRATRLMLVVLCLELTDLIFAVDSVSAIVAQIPDLYLAYTACVFAMLGLRAMFFVIDELVSMFSLLGYGVAVILIFIGLKLIFQPWIHVPPWIVLLILLTILASSIIASVIWERMKEEEQEKEVADMKEKMADMRQP
eukprot:gnl/TRDRNA2_/TRDRNA2_181770_c0_seq1.p1 gnl/TRDRNA2_/TRDRNA2_181770_c0~~gnl/TRDRNA2_/TRDRNA2_181770_c0_seq1.p1  ORF type:complete len:462 (-),score=78.08 gnl/TRDRNA2_/TRDRNA2_181770_c0_seq1:140-1525(-)